ncbi:hypothetical protein HPB47_028009 [Ixodes persulcatus]|uniref:Uncharacterized protein n=1 Tax=Ixodes persulcatus TaxID=34615 RepID=A0AC60PVP6_IXOPE|nr:hypothetical protein HPB47_028009 [Ixodes persulcatus]
MDRVLLEALEGAPKGRLEDGGALLQAVLDCLDLQPDQRGAVVRHPVGFAPEVVLDFVRSITALEADDVGVCSGETRLDGNNNENIDKHLLDTSLEALDCDYAPVLLPLVATRVSDPGVTSNGSLGDLRRGVQHLSLTTSVDEERAVLTKVLHAVHQLGKAETTEDSTRPSELENLRETESTTVTEGTSEPNTSTGDEIGDSEEQSNNTTNSDRTSSIATRTVVTADRSVLADRSVELVSSDDTANPEETSPTAAGMVITIEDRSALDLSALPDPMLQQGYLLMQAEQQSIDLIRPTMSHFEPLVDVNSLYALRCVQGNLFREYTTLLQSQMEPTVHHVSEPEMNQSFGTSQPVPYYYHNANFIDPLDGGPYQAETPLLLEYEDPSPFPPSNCNPEEVVAAHVDDSPFPLPYMLSHFEQPASGEVDIGNPQADIFNSGSFPSSVDEKSFINFLFSNMSNDAPDGKSADDVNQCLLQLSSNGLFQETTERLRQTVGEMVAPGEEPSLLYHLGDPVQLELIDRNNNLVQEDNNIHPKLTTIDEFDHGIELATERETLSSTQARTDISDDDECTQTSSAKSSVETVQKGTEAKKTVSNQTEHQKTLHAFSLQIEDRVPEFLQLLQEKNMFKDNNDNLVTESGQILLPADPARATDLLPAEPERNYNVLKTSPELRGWRKARTSPISDGKRTQSSNSGSSSSVEGETKPRRRNPRRTFFDAASSTSSTAEKTCFQRTSRPSPVHQSRTVYHASGGFSRQEGQTAPSEPQQYPAPGHHQEVLLSRGLHTEVPLSFAQEEIRFDCDSPLFPGLRLRPSGHSVWDIRSPMVSPLDMSSVLTAEDGSDRGNSGSLLQSFDEVHPSAVKKTPTVVNLMPKISEEQVDWWPACLPEEPGYHP